MMLSDLLQRTARYCDRIDEYNDNPAEEQLKIRLIDALNEAYFLICRKHHKLLKRENITLDSLNEFDLSTLTSSVVEVKDILVNGLSTDFTIELNHTLNVPFTRSSDVTIEYYYLPDKLRLDTSQPVFSETIVDMDLLCWYATARFWEQEKAYDRASYYQIKFDSNISKITPVNKTRRIPAREFR